MKISVIIPLYNKAPYVTKALESVKAQTFTDWECIIVNDGSTDKSAEIVERLTINDERFRLINQENAGGSAARNRGIREALNDERLTMNGRCEYVCFLDADDWWAPTFLEDMVMFAEEYPETGLYASNYIYYKPGKTRVGVKANVIEDCRLKIDDCDSPYINYPKAYFENGEQVVWTGAVLVPRAVLDNLAQHSTFNVQLSEWFPLGIKLGEDFLLWARIAMQYPVAFLNKPLAYYNNDVPAKLRLTQNLHKPEAHMLWQLDDIDDCRLKIEDCELKKDWTRLLDWLRVSGLMVYWMSDEYHEAAAKELKKVTGVLPKAYKLPIWWLRIKKYIMTVGSYCKQLIIRK